MHETSYDANVDTKGHVKTIRLSQNGRSAPDSIVTLNVRDAPIRNVLGLLVIADVSKFLSPVNILKPNNIILAQI